MDEKKSIDVTPEMISSGVEALRAHVGDACFVLTDEEIVEIIFSAMLAEYKSDTPGPKVQCAQRQD